MRAVVPNVPALCFGALTGAVRQAQVAPLPKADKSRIMPRAYTLQRELLPAGYRARIFNSPEEEQRAAGPRSRFIVSDGISWAEVFLSPIEAGEQAIAAVEHVPSGQLVAYNDVGMLFSPPPAAMNLLATISLTTSTRSPSPDGGT